MEDCNKHALWTLIGILGAEALMISYFFIDGCNHKTYVKQNLFSGTAIVRADYYSDMSGEYIISTTENKIIRTDGRLSGDYETPVSNYAATFEKGDKVKFVGYPSKTDANVIYFNKLEKIVE